MAGSQMMTHGKSHHSFRTSYQLGEGIDLTELSELTWFPWTSGKTMYNIGSGKTGKHDQDLETRCLL